MDEQQDPQGQSAPLPTDAPLTYSAPELPPGLTLSPDALLLLLDRTGKPRRAPATRTYSASGLPASTSFRYDGTSSH